MLSKLLADYAALHQALGFKFRTPGILLRNFVAFAENRGEHVITTATVHEWALQAPSPEQRRNRLLAVRRCLTHDGSSFSEVGASGKPGAVHVAELLASVMSVPSVQLAMLTPAPRERNWRLDRTGGLTN